jgi:hypothetical protein
MQAWRSNGLNCLMREHLARSLSLSLSLSRHVYPFSGGLGFVVVA